MSKDTVIDLVTPEQIDPSLADLLRSGARKLIAEAIEAELDEVLMHFPKRGPVMADNGWSESDITPERGILTGVGRVDVQLPKIQSRAGDAVSFRSSLVPPYIRKTATLEVAIPWLYLKGISTGQMQGTLEAIVGLEAKGVSAG